MSLLKGDLAHFLFPAAVDEIRMGIVRGSDECFIGKSLSTQTNMQTV